MKHESEEDLSVNGSTPVKIQDEEPLEETSEFSQVTLVRNGSVSEDSFKTRKKRVHSVSRGSKKFSPLKKRKYREGIVPPTKFLLGGNIYDPLNLRSMQDEDVNKALNAYTPKSSPVPTPKHRKEKVEVIIPPNVQDPLSLMDSGDDTNYEQKLTLHNMSVQRAQGKAVTESYGSELGRDSKENTSSRSESVSDVDLPGKDNKTSQAMPCDQNVTLKIQEDSCVIRESSFKRDCESSESASGGEMKGKKKRRNPIVSPVVPQPGSRIVRGGVHSKRNFRNTVKGSQQQMPRFQAKNIRFQYGNYSRYYGYRNPAHEPDSRLKCFAERSLIFQDKEVLDIGCNIGHITLTIARDFKAKRVVGLDIDRSLIDIARKNVKHYIKCVQASPGHQPSNSRTFPISMPILYGNVNLQSFDEAEGSSLCERFPDNVSFVHGNYVLETDDLLTTERAQFDVILCLSLTKWIHLNWGDVGLQRAFKRMYLQLRPGGILILEIQPLDSYKRKKTLTETIYKNFNSMKFMPNQFVSYLLSSEVGFMKCETIGVPHHRSKGFQRPILMLLKGEPPSFASSDGVSSCTAEHSDCVNDAQENKS